MITTDTGAKKIEGTDNWRLIFYAHNDSVDAHDQAIAKKLLMPSSRITVPTGSSGYTGSLSGLTADYILLKWNFYTAASGGSVIAENNPPADMEWSTTTDSFTIKTGGSSSVYCQPVFGKPN